MKKVLILFATIVFSCHLLAQSFEVPQNYTLSKVEDYKQHEQNIVDCVDWLIQTPIGDKTSKRKEANVFLVTWLTGSPNVSIELHSYVMGITEDSPEFLSVFMGGWAKYAISTKNYDNVLDGNLAGIDAVIATYKNSRDVLPKSNSIEKFIKLKQKGKLRAFIKDQIEVK